MLCKLSKRDNHSIENLKINLKMHYTHVSFIWIKEGRNNLNMAKKSVKFVELLNSFVTNKWYSTDDTAYSKEYD